MSDFAKRALADRVHAVPPSGIRRFFDIAATMSDVISLGVGEPDFDTPPHIIEAAVASLRAGRTHYTSNLGTDYSFREGLLKGLSAGFGVRYRGKMVVGYRGADTIVNPANPATAIDDPNVDAYTVVWQKAYFLGTATLGYPVKLPGRRKVDLNLSITNLFNYDRPLYNTIGLRAANGDISSPARVSYPRYFSYTTPRSFRLSATTTF